MTAPAITYAPLVRRHCQRVQPHGDAGRLPGPCFFVLVVLSSTPAPDYLPVACVLFSLN